MSAFSRILGVHTQVLRLAWRGLYLLVCLLVLCIDSKKGESNIVIQGTQSRGLGRAAGLRKKWVFWAAKSVVYLSCAGGE